MPRFFMHLRDGTDVALDEEGTEHASIEAMQQAVLASARDCIAGDVKATGVVDFRFRIDAENEAGEVVYSLPFAEAVTIMSD